MVFGTFLDQFHIVATQFGGTCALKRLSRLVLDLYGDFQN